MVWHDCPFDHYLNDEQPLSQVDRTLELLYAGLQDGPRHSLMILTLFERPDHGVHGSFQHCN